MAGEQLQEALIAAAREGRKPAEVDFTRVPVEVRPALVELLSGLTEAARQSIPAVDDTVPQAPALALLSQDALRFGEAGEIFGGQAFFGPAASQMTYGVETPADQVSVITFPTAFLEQCKRRGGQLRLHVDKAPDGKPLTMPVMHRLTLERWGQQDKGKLLYDTGGWKATETFFTLKAPRPGWRVVFPNIVEGTTGEDDLAQTELLIAELAVLFRGTPVPRAYEQAIAEFEARKAGTRVLMEDDKKWPQASEAIEGFTFSGIARPLPSEVTDIIAVNVEGTGNRPFQNVYVRTPVRSSSGCLVRVGGSEPDGADVYSSHPGRALPNVGASLSLQSW